MLLRRSGESLVCWHPLNNVFVLSLRGAFKLISLGMIGGGDFASNVQWVVGEFRLF